MSKHPLACLSRKGICESALGNSQNPLALSSQEQCPDTLQNWSHGRTSLPTAGHWTHQHWCQARMPTVTSTATSTSATVMPETQPHSYYWLSNLDVSCYPHKQTDSTQSTLSHVVFFWSFIWVSGIAGALVTCPFLSCKGGREITFPGLSLGRWGKGSS